MTTDPNDPPGDAAARTRLLGRQPVVDRIEAALDDLEAGRGGALTIRGEAGIGKTTVLDVAAASAAARGVHVVRVVASEWEQELTWGVLLDLVRAADRRGRPRGDGGRLTALFDRRGESDRFALVVEVLELLAFIGAEHPTLVVVDDLHWVDPASRAVLGSVARRLGDEAVLVVAASRPTSGAGDRPADHQAADDRAAGGRPAADRVVSGSRHVEVLGVEPLGDVVDIGPFAPTDAVDLLRSLGITDAARRDAIVDVAGGVPLVLHEMAHEARRPEAADPRSIGADLPLPVGPRAESLVARRLDALPGRCLDALVVCAADSSNRTAIVSDGLARLGFDLRDLEPAERERLLDVDLEHVRFTHPLVRTVAYHRAAAPTRRRVHAALAEAEAEAALGAAGRSDRALRHRLRAALEPDATLSADLEAAARVAAADDAPLAAADLFDDAARVAVDAGRSDELVLDAAEAALAAGEPVRASRSLDRHTGTGPSSRPDAIRVRIALGRGALDDAVAGALALAADPDHDPDVVTGALIECFAVALPSLRLHDATTLAMEVASRRARLGPAVARRADLVEGAAAFLRGDHETTIGLFAGWPGLLAQEGPGTAGPFLSQVVAPVLAYGNRRVEAEGLLEQVIAAARAAPAPVALAVALGALATVRYSVDFAGCVAAGQEAMALADELGMADRVVQARSALVLALAATVDEEACRSVAAGLVTTGDPGLEVAGRAALAKLELSLGRAAEAHAALEPVLDERFAAARRGLVVESDLAEALVRLGRPDDAAPHLDHLDALAAAGDRWAGGQRERVLALAATDDVASSHFAAAVDELVASGNRYAEALARLQWGERLRRLKRRAEARERLESARAIFEDIRTPWWVHRCERELAGAGVVVDATRPVYELLTATELAVARTAVAGATNREIGASLFLSPRTVETHLSAVYRKLGVRGRAGLANRALVEPDLRAG